MLILSTSAQFSSSSGDSSSDSSSDSSGSSSSSSSGSSSSGSSSSEKYSGNSSGAQFCKAKYGPDYTYYDPSTKKCSNMKLDKSATAVILNYNKLKIGYASNAKSTLSDYSINLLNEILKNTKVQGITITSTTRTAEDQARIMYDNLIGKGKNQGVEEQYKLYGNCGDLVIKAFEDESKKTKDPNQIKAAMLSKMKEIGAHKVSHHALDPADYNKLNVLDIAPSVADKQGFEAAIKKAISEGKIINFYSPSTGDPAYHLEIPQTNLPKDFTKPCDQVRR